jgi:hypothetical protein
MRPYEKEGFEWGLFGLKWIKNGKVRRTLTSLNVAHQQVNYRSDRG